MFSVNQNYLSFFTLFFLMICCAGCIHPDFQQYNQNRTIVSAISGSNNSQINEPVFSNGTVITNGTWIAVDPVSNHKIGDIFTIAGKTNFRSNEKVFIQVFPGESYIIDRYGQCAGCHESEILTFSTYDFVNVTKGDNGINRWSLTVNTSRWLPVLYKVTVSDINRNTTAATTSTTFSLSGGVE
jgi:hypothetical protein